MKKRTSKKSPRKTKMKKRVKEKSPYADPRPVQTLMKPIAR